jgi:hypothetical protein
MVAKGREEVLFRSAEVTRVTTGETVVGPGTEDRACVAGGGLAVDSGTNDRFGVCVELLLVAVKAVADDDATVEIGAWNGTGVPDI